MSRIEEESVMEKNIRKALDPGLTMVQNASCILKKIPLELYVELSRPLLFGSRMMAFKYDKYENYMVNYGYYANELKKHAKIVGDGHHTAVEKSRPAGILDRERLGVAV